MDKANVSEQDHGVTITRRPKDQSVCTCDGSLPQLDAKSKVPTCGKCGGRIIR